MDPVRNLALTELLQLWSKRADCLHAVDVATAEFRRAVVRAKDAGVPLKHMARVMGVTPALSASTAPLAGPHRQQRRRKRFGEG